MFRAINIFNVYCLSLFRPKYERRIIYLLLQIKYSFRILSVGINFSEAPDTVNAVL